ncbi:D-alanyl-D-alanine carboxypeptidase [Streptomyces sp. GQFP]|uniref:D-alanyl-D-alanine carboxypeptidase n=1 Tax=Streptomyces sp. GQFP TaxID=2907545 RepID=UPI001F3C461D|nr:D-alanyl-D-alanine carboxypeptidase [Streptomyces sp. GQFP]UIX33324.1 D-alanyl-D-alanine carboxypeptidase [Streptomyces sp. GQFP]
MEEASVAGEFPDRSKQRESSEEPTSGSAGPVPGARGESGAGARDPRLAVARDRESTARGGVDTATRVFSRPPLPADEGDASTPGAAPEAGSEPEDAVPADGGTDGTGSTRLRTAVAAWVASADEGEGKDGSEGAEAAADTDADPDPDTDATADAPEGDEEPAADAAADAGPDEPSEAADEAPEGADEASGDSDEDSAESKSAQESKSAPGTEPEPRPEADAEPKPAAEAEGAAGLKPTADAAAEPKSDSDTEPRDAAESKLDADVPAEPKPDAEGAADSKSKLDPRVAAEPKSDSEPRDAAEPKLDADVPAEPKPGAEGAAGSKAKSGAEPEGTAGSKSDAEAAAEQKSDPEGVADSNVKPDVAEPKSKPGTEDAADSKAKADAAEPKSKSKPDAEPEGAVDSESKPDAAADTEAEVDGDADGDAAPAPAPASDAADPAPKPPVDQPTAIFKAVRPPAAPSVDQPTTMLKLGDVAAGKAKAAEKSAGETAEADAKDANAESVAERTSKFVALRQLDDPATRKPPSAAPPAAETANAPAAQSPKAPVADATAAIPQVGPERTTQQPLPPLPPLDLLAELTNTPPPPNTAVRTIARRIKIWTPLVVLLAIIFAVVQAVRPLPTPELTLTAEDSYTFDGAAAALPWPSEGQGWMDVNGIGTMGKFGEQKAVGIGSVAKAMTAYVVLKDHPLKSGEDGPKITVDALAEKEAGYWKEGESTLTTAKEGDTLTLKQAISAIMIPSANNIARLLARWDAGSEAAFIKKMNDTAKELGMKNTNYTDASGLKETTVSTAEDQVKLGNELVRIPAFTDITKLPVWYDHTGKKWDNYNRLVPYNGAIGIKTGTTTAAGGNLLFAATKEVGGETVTVVGAILGQHTAPIIDTVNAVSKTAMIAARDALLSSKILKKGDVVGYVDDGLGGHTPVVLSKDVTAVGWAGMKVELSFAAAEDLPHSAKAGTTVGSLTVGDGSGGAVKVPVQLQSDLVEPGYDKKLTRVG